MSDASSEETEVQDDEDEALAEESSNEDEESTFLSPEELEEERRDQAARRIQSMLHYRRAHLLVVEVMKTVYTKQYDPKKKRYVYIEKRSGVMHLQKPKLLGSAELPTPRLFKAPDNYDSGASGRTQHVMLVTVSKFVAKGLDDLPKSYGRDHDLLEKTLTHPFIGKVRLDNTVSVKNARVDVFRRQMDSLARSCAVDSAFLLYLCTNMGWLKKGDQKGSFVLFADSAWGNPKQITNTCMSLTELADLIRAIPSREKVVLLHTCHGDVPTDSMFKTKLLYPDPDMYHTLSRLANVPVIGACHIGTLKINMPKYRGRTSSRQRLKENEEQRAAAAAAVANAVTPAIRETLKARAQELEDAVAAEAGGDDGDDDAVSGGGVAADDGLVTGRSGATSVAGTEQFFRDGEGGGGAAQAEREEAQRQAEREQKEAKKAERRKQKKKRKKNRAVDVVVEREPKDKAKNKSGTAASAEGAGSHGADGASQEGSRAGNQSSDAEKNDDTYDDVEESESEDEDAMYAWRIASADVIDPMQPRIIVSRKRGIECDYEIDVPTQWELKRFKLGRDWDEMKENTTGVVKRAVARRYQRYKKLRACTERELCISTNKTTLFGDGLLRALRGGACDPQYDRVSVEELFDYLRAIMRKRLTSLFSSHADTPTQRPVLVLPERHESDSVTVWDKVSVPPAPFKPFPIEIRHTGITLQWNMPEFEGVSAREFQIWGRAETRTGSQWAPLAEFATIRDQMFHVPHLTAGIPMQFRVRASNAGGWGEPSVPSQTLTPGINEKPLDTAQLWRNAALGGALSLVIRMESFPHLLAEQVNGLRLLASVANRPDTFARKFACTRGADVVRRAMQDYPDNIHIQQLGLTILGWICRARDDARRYIADESRPKAAVLVAANLHKFDHDPVVHSACRWLTANAEDPALKIAEEAAAAVSAAGGAIRGAARGTRGSAMVASGKAKQSKAHAESFGMVERDLSNPRRQLQPFGVGAAGGGARARRRASMSEVDTSSIHQLRRDPTIRIVERFRGKLPPPDHKPKSGEEPPPAPTEETEGAAAEAAAADTANAMAAQDSEESEDTVRMSKKERRKSKKAKAREKMRRKRNRRKFINGRWVWEDDLRKEENERKQRAELAKLKQYPTVQVLREWTAWGPEYGKDKLSRR